MFIPTAKKAVSTDQLEPLNYYSKWLKERYEKVEKTETDKSLKGFKKQLDVAYKEGYLQAISDATICLTNLLRTGKIK